MGFLFLLGAIPWLYLCYWTKQLEIESEEELKRKIKEYEMKRRKYND